MQGIVTDPFLSLKIRREYLIRDSLDQLQARQKELKKKLKIQFINEQGIDAGGLTKEWFLLLINQVFDPSYGMFVLDDKSHLCWFNGCSHESPEQYRLLGIVLGLAIYNNTILNAPFPLACFKKLCK